MRMDMVKRDNNPTTTLYTGKAKQWPLYTPAMLKVKTKQEIQRTEISDLGQESTI